MLQEERYEKILSILSEKKHVTIEQIQKTLQISLSTVRRDFRTLVERDLAIRSRGGISCRTVNRENDYFPFELRRITHVKEKEKLAHAAASLLNPNDTFFIDGGTTTLHLVRCLPNYPLTAVTNSLPHVSAMIENHFRNAHLEIYSAGGMVYAPWKVNLGPQARYCLSQYHAQYAFLSCRGIDASGTYNHNELVVETERTMMANADKVVFIVDHSKIGTRAMSFLCDLDEIDILITSKRSADLEIIKTFQEHSMEIMFVNE
ncbi:MAG: DeoR/GlpR transcriptional regulator [Candidatus Omnitrophica bacterium]|nr:DeoR/GlpR transcriptional regulator [Candidatus Omnitrophota bacterium]